MAELILSEITLMRQGYCVIGVQQVAMNFLQSIRPLPPTGNSWPDPFDFKRGDYVRCQLAPIGASPPHIEDRQSRGLVKTGRSLGETELVENLHRAEVSHNLEDLFACELESDTPRGNSWVHPEMATRSISGCEYRNIQFRVFFNPGRVTLRAKVVLPSNEILHSLPVVDRDWNEFLTKLGENFDDIGVDAAIQDFLNQSIREKLLQALHCFARIGLTRPDQAGKCWLMLDSLFPQPKDAWLDEL